MIRRLHRGFALVFGAFVVVHLAHHLTILGGAELHLAVQSTLRAVYRHPLVEPLILFAAVLQMGLGLALVRRRGWPRHWVARVQIISGVVLALFLIQHVGATVVTRMIYDSQFTNTYWAAAVLSRAPFTWYFVPYYAAGIIALGFHLAALVAKRRQRRPFALALSGVSVVLAVLIVAGFAGVFQPISLPEAYVAYIDNYWLPF